MGRVSSVSQGQVIDPTSFGNALITDYVSQTDSTAQSIASALECKASLTVGTGMTTISKLKLFTASGSNPIVVTHGMGSAPKIIVSANALQPYALAWNSDATNITIYHNAAGSLSVSIIAWV